ncbi:MAG: hypothetical protein JO013_14470 [Alphaproteobacteria bacterium]|nr:hypothetical protein [Alphaproteobacteria bacterium]
MAGLRLEDFEATVGESWQVEAGGRAVPMRLEAAQSLSRALRAEGGFRLEWSGPADPLLPQGIYRFRRDGRDAEMFIVPVAQAGDGFRYEAIFN